MSNSLAIAAVTATMRSLLTQGISLDADLADAQVTAQPPDRARGNNNANQVNIFLYQTLPNAAWRNLPLPTEVKPNETGQPPLALNLYYLITAYGRDNDDIYSHRLMGRAMSVLHDHPLLGRDEIRTATANELPDNDLYNQLERVRFTLQPLSLEDIFKLWSGFQTQYRLSTAYEATVVLIDSTRPTRTPLPVLTRGQDDRGVISQASILPPFPALENVRLRGDQMSAHLGDLLTLEGRHLDGQSVVVRFSSPLLPEPDPPNPYPYDVPVEPGGTAETITVRVPNQPNAWPTGFYTVSAIVQPMGEVDHKSDHTTNALPISLAPRVTSALPINAVLAGDGTARVALTCSPQVWPEQRASLLLSDTEVPAERHPARTGNLTFMIRGVGRGDYLFRLRIDGVDSLLIDRSVTPPRFDPSQTVHIT